MLFPVKGSTTQGLFRSKGRLENLAIDTRGHPGHVALDKLDSVPPNKAQVYYRAQAHDGTDLQISTVPKASRVLRCERFYIRSEAATIRWLSGCRADAAPGDEVEKTSRKVLDEAENSHSDADISQYLPDLVDLQVKKNGQEEIVFANPASGTTVASLPYSLCSNCRSMVDFQVGKLLYQILRHRSPQLNFGGATAVLGPGPDSIWPSNAADWATPHATWSGAFMFLLESVLRDSEDVAITIPYERIRANLRRFRPALDAVKVPFLVITDAGEDDNILVSTRSRPNFEAANDAAVQSENSTSWSRRQTTAVAAKDTDSMGPSTQEPVRDGQQQESHPKKRGQDRCTSCDRHVLVTGLRDWCKSIFGDPLFASVLSNKESPEIWNALISSAREAGASDLGNYLQDLGSDPFETARRYIYRIYYAVVAIAIEYYRMTSDSDERELPARKRLMESLDALDGLEDSGRPRHPRSISEAPPAKRQKSE